jgi:hypothetical protein
VGIDLRIEDVRGNVLASLGDPGGCVTKFLMMIDATSTSCLRLLDPHDEAVLDQAQMSTLATEIEATAGSASIAKLVEERHRFLEGAVEANWQPAVIAELRRGLDAAPPPEVEREQIMAHVLEVATTLRDGVASGVADHARFIGD